MSNQVSAIHAELIKSTQGVQGRFARALTRHVATDARVVMGLVFLVFGLNGFFNFLPAPSGPVPEGAMAFGFALRPPES